MRWRFIDENSEVEMAYRLKNIEKIDSFWRTFEGNVDTITRSSKSCADWVTRELPKVSEELMWEMSPAIDNVRRFVITPEQNYHLHPMVASMIERAPKIPGFRFMPYREAVEPESVIDVVTARSGTWIADVTVLATAGDENAIDVVFMSSHFNGNNNHDDIGYCFTLLEVLLGQVVVEEWIGQIETLLTKPGRMKQLKSFLSGSKDVHSIKGIGVFDLPKFVSNLREEIVERLPKQPIWQLDSELATDSGSVLEFRGPDTRRMTCSTFLPQVILGAIPPPVCFTSARFSRFGETFCYLKIDESLARTDEDLDRGELQEIFDSALREASVGCVTGGGWGPIYNFIDFALTDVNNAIPVLRQVSAKVSVPKSSWLRFLDTKLIHEWVGMFADTPQPDLSPDW